MIRGGAGQVAGNVAQTLPRPEFGQEAANARLIVKAPDMYELLEAVIAATTHESTKYILQKLFPKKNLLSQDTMSYGRSLGNK